MINRGLMMINIHAHVIVVNRYCMCPNPWANKQGHNSSFIRTNTFHHYDVYTG